MKRVLALAAMFLASPVLAQQAVPQIPFESVPNFLKLPPGVHLGEVPGVAVNSKGHVFVFTRSNSAGGPAYAPAAARGRLLTASAWTATTTSGPSTRARTWWLGLVPQARS
jgi:hypothetical protein